MFSAYSEYLLRDDSRVHNTYLLACSVLMDATPSAMYNVLVILLHRPFVADGHLYSTSRSITVDSFMKCASAASAISSLLRAYHRAFSIRRAPYLISYSTYVAATIHTRIAARRGSDSAAHTDLATCLAVFEENQGTNSAVKKAAIIVQALMKKHGVVVQNVSSDALALEVSQRQDRHPEQATDRYIQSVSSSIADRQVDSLAQEAAPEVRHPATGISMCRTDCSPGSDWLDVDGIIQNFLLQGDGHESFDHEAPSGQTQVPREQWASQQPGGSAQPVLMRGMPPVDQGLMGQDLAPNTVTHGDGTYVAGYPSQQGWKLSSGDYASLEDPLFGFNGSSLDGFPLMGW